MSKEKESAPLKEFNILDTPFGEGLEMQFTDEFKEDNSVSKTSLDSSLTNEVDETPVDETAKTETKEVKKETKETPIQETEEEVKGTTSTESTETTTSEDSSLKVFASWLGDKGLVDYDEETFEDSEDGLKKLMSSTVEKEVERYKQSLPEDVHKLVEFVEAGGDPKQFMDLYYNQSSWADFKLEDESDSKAVLKEYLKAQGEDEDEINETLDTYEISGILEKKAKAAEA